MSLDRTRRDGQPLEPERVDAAPTTPMAPLLLRDQRVHEPRMASVRASLARAAQAGSGNHALSAMLMRDPPASPPKVAHKTGKEVDDALDASARAGDRALPPRA